MGHPGKHVIDPETGLCEICDQGAIREIHQGRRPAKKVYYGDHDDIPYTKDRYVYDVDDEPQPRYVRKVVRHPPTVRPRRAVYEQPIEEPIVVRRKIVRREHTPEESPRRYVVRPKETLPPPSPPPARKVRVVRRYIQTPPPPATEVWHDTPRRKINSDTEIIDRRQRVRREEMTYTPPIHAKPEMYHLEGVPDDNRYSPVDRPMYSSREYRTPSPRVVEQNERNRRPNRVEPLPQRTNRPAPTVVRRVYEKLPPGKQQPERKAVRNFPPPNQTRVSNGNAQRPGSGKNPSLYYIRSVDNYD